MATSKNSVFSLKHVAFIVFPICLMLFGCGDPHRFGALERVVRSEDSIKSHAIQYQDEVMPNVGVPIENAYVLRIWESSDEALNKSLRLFDSTMDRTDSSGSFWFDDSTLEIETRHIIVRKSRYEQAYMSYKYSGGLPFPDGFYYLVLLRPSIDENTNSHGDITSIKTEKNRTIDVNLHFRYHRILNIYWAIIHYSYEHKGNLPFDDKGSDAALLSLAEGEIRGSHMKCIVKDDLIRDCSAVKESSGVDYLYFNPESKKKIKFTTIVLVEKNFYFGDRSLFAVSASGDVFYLNNSKWEPSELIGQQYGKLKIYPFKKY